MYQNKKQQKSYTLQQNTQKMQIPQLKKKAYSFADPLLQSFHNNSPERGKNFQSRPNELFHHKNQILNINQSRMESQLYSQLQELSQRMILMSKILKMNKEITNPSVLMLNSQNKMKTKMLIESKKLNNDENSIILCENANKYLTFLNVLSEIQNQHQNGSYFKENYQNDVRFNLESRVGDQKQKRKLREIHDQGDSNSFDSRHLELNPKTRSFSSGLSTAEKMFQEIKTPHNEVKQDSFAFTPLRQPNRYQGQVTNLQTEGKKTKHGKSPQSSAILQVKSNPPKTQESQIHTFNKKTDQSNYKPPIFKKKNQRTEVSRSKSNNEKPKQNQIKQKKTFTKETIKSIRSFTNIQPMIDSKNLVYKTIDKTSQFQKMLKMASSRMNPN